MEEGQRPDIYHRLIDRYGNRGEALYMLCTGFVAITINGLAAYFLKQPLLFPSLSPTVFIVFRQPLGEDCCPRNVIIGHFLALCVEVGMLYLFGLQSQPSVLQEGVTFPRVWAASFSVAITEALLLLIRRPHTPAGTTTLLASLGLFTTFSQFVSLMAGIVMIVVVSWTINRSLGVKVPVWGPKE